MSADHSRFAFEAFAQRCPMGNYSIQRDTRPGKENGYWSSHTQIMWDSWQASRAAQPAVSAGNMPPLPRYSIYVGGGCNGPFVDADESASGSWVKHADAQAHAAAQCAVLVDALEWYAEQTRLCRLIHSEGDKGRQALAADGGDKARTALAAHKGST